MPIDLVGAGRRIARAVPAARPALQSMHHSGERLLGRVAEHWPSVVRARTEKITVAVTAHCNFRCIGCRYGRDFMPGAQLPLHIVEDLLEDAHAAGVPAVRLYGGEPLLHPDLPAMFEKAQSLGIGAYLTTNALILDRRIDALHAAGLRKATIGFYGTGAAFDDYVQRGGRYERLLESLHSTRARYGPDTLALQFNFLLHRGTCDIDSFERARAIAERFDARMQIDIVHYSLPYFQEGPERNLQFRDRDADRLNRMAEHLVRLKAAKPDLLTESAASLASIPDWALKTDRMRVPCDAGKLLWVGADGSVKLCYVTFDLGNLHQTRLRDLIGTSRHHDHARSAFRLDCPNCHCERGARVMKHAPSARLYRERAAAMLRD